MKRIEQLHNKFTTAQYFTMLHNNFLAFKVFYYSRALQSVLLTYTNFSLFSTYFTLTHTNTNTDTNAMVFLVVYIPSFFLSYYLISMSSAFGKKLPFVLFRNLQSHLCSVVSSHFKTASTCPLVEVIMSFVSMLFFPSRVPSYLISVFQHSVTVHT